MNGYDSQFNRSLGLVEGLHETPGDLAKERQAAEIIRQRYGWEKITKVCGKYPMDFGAETDGLLVAFLEVKCRNIRFKQYPNLILSMAKYQDLFECSVCNGIPVYLVASLLDGVYAHKVAFPARLKKFMGGRTDRENPNDTEPMVAIPWEDFE